MYPSLFEYVDKNKFIMPFQCVYYLSVTLRWCPY